MHPVSLRRGGFTLIEALIGLAIIGISLAIGMPAVFDWVRTTKINGATEFYAEGFRLARAEAIKHKAWSRIVLDEGANGQLGWQVDICYPINGVVCNANTGGWSTPTAIAANEPEGAVGFKSVVRSADTLPPQSMLNQVVAPVGADSVYFTSLGWVDTAVPARLTRLTLQPVSGSSITFAPSAIAITLSGMVSKCNPAVAASDSRGCPPT